MIVHLVFLSLSVIITFLWANHPSLQIYNLQLTALLVIIYFTSKFFLKSRSRLYDIESILILTTICLLLIFSTGNLDSPLLFLLDFLLFALALLFEPLVTLILSIVIVSILTVTNLSHLTTINLVNLLAILLITPLAIFFGRKYLENQFSLGKIKILEHCLAREETDTLLWLSTRAKPTFAGILETTSLIISSNTLPFSLQEKIKKVHTDLLSLHRSADNLENDISNGK